MQMKGPWDIINKVCDILPSLWIITWDIVNQVCDS